MGFADDMKDFDEEFEQAREEPNNYNQLPDGNHRVLIVESRVEQRQSDEAYQWYLKFTNAHGTVRKWTNLDHPVGRKVAASDCKTLGYDGKLSQLEQACKDGVFEHLVCQINVQTKPGDQRDFTNVYINGCFGRGEPDAYVATDVGEQFVPAGAADSDDDIPF